MGHNPKNCCPVCGSAYSDMKSMDRNSSDFWIWICRGCGNEYDNKNDLWKFRKDSVCDICHQIKASTHERYDGDLRHGKYCDPCWIRISSDLEDKRREDVAMKIESKNNEIILREVYSGVGLISNDGEEFGICMRDSGFEFTYAGKWYAAKEGNIICLSDIKSEKVENPDSGPLSADLNKVFSESKE